MLLVVCAPSNLAVVLLRVAFDLSLINVIMLRVNQGAALTVLSPEMKKVLKLGILLVDQFLIAQLLSITEPEFLGTEKSSSTSNSHSIPDLDLILQLWVLALSHPLILLPIEFVGTVAHLREDVIKLREYVLIVRVLCVLKRPHIGIDINKFFYIKEDMRVG